MNPFLALALTAPLALAAFSGSPSPALARPAASPAASPAALEPAPVAAATLKFATLLPEGSLWDKELRQLSESLKQGTDGRASLRIYPGGVAGDEPDVLRKLRIGQLSGAMLTLTGLGDIDPGLNVFLIPLYFRSDAESRQVLERMDGVFRKRLEQHGYVLVNWVHLGWIDFFSTEKVETVDDLKRLKQFVWAGHSDIAGWYQEAGFRPVPLAATDMLTGLQTGMIQALPSTPLTALSLQWFRSAPHMLDLPVAPLYGANVLTARAWKELSAADREVLLAAGRRSQETLMVEVPKQEREALAAMKERGLVVHAPKPSADDASWRALSEHFAKRMRDKLIPREVLDAVAGHLAELRGAAGAGTQGGGGG
jgi:TRAP-type C4-dicarboxylate transport system substrate-binding protein